MPRPMTALEMSRRVMGQQLRPLGAGLPAMEGEPVDEAEAAGALQGPVMRGDPVPAPAPAPVANPAPAPAPAPAPVAGGGTDPVGPPMTAEYGGWQNPGAAMDARPPVSVQGGPPPVSINGRQPDALPTGAYDRMVAAGDQAFTQAQKRINDAFSFGAGNQRLYQSGMDGAWPTYRMESPGEAQNRVMAPLQSAFNESTQEGRLALDRFLGTGNLGIRQQEADTARQLGLGNLDVNRGNLDVNRGTLDLGQRRNTLDEYRFAADMGPERQESQAVAGMLAQGRTPEQARAAGRLMRQITGGRPQASGFVPGQPYGQGGNIPVGPPPPVVIGGPGGGPAGTDAPPPGGPRGRGPAPAGANPVPSPDTEWSQHFGDDFMARLAEGGDLHGKDMRDVAVALTGTLEGRRQQWDPALVQRFLTERPGLGGAPAFERFINPGRARRFWDRTSNMLGLGGGQDDAREQTSSALRQALGRPNQRYRFEGGRTPFSLSSITGN